MKAFLAPVLTAARSLVKGGQSLENKDEDKTPSHDTCDHLNEKD
jgi:hypothetical protein